MNSWVKVLRCFMYSLQSGHLFLTRYSVIILPTSNFCPIHISITITSFMNDTFARASIIIIGAHAIYPLMPFSNTQSFNSYHLRFCVVLQPFVRASHVFKILGCVVNIIFKWRSKTVQLQLHIMIMTMAMTGDDDRYWLNLNHKYLI